jgi:PilZ domain-containing protein
MGMATDVSVIIADVSRLGAIRDGVRPSGRVMHYTSGSLAAAMESIRSCHPKLVAIDAHFAQTSPGAAFLERVEALAVPGTSIKLIVDLDGRWFLAPRSGTVLGMPTASRVIVAPAAVSEIAAPTRPADAATVSTAAIAAQVTGPNTRRAPRFAVQNRVVAAVENGRAALIDISVLGAQLESIPTLRPNQRITLGLPDANEMLNLVAQVAWSTFQKPSRAAEPFYRAGIEFTSAAREALEDYRQRHCASEPIPCRGR